MAEFSYIAIDSSGARIPGQLTASSRGEALQVLSVRSVFPLSLRECRTVSRKGRSVRPAVLCSLFTLLADQLETGVPLLRAIQVLMQQSRDENLRAKLSCIAEDVAHGASLGVAVGRHPDVFSELDVSIIQAGEEGGFLQEALLRLAVVRERQEEVRSRLLSALAYPLLLAVVGLLVVSGMLVFFVPKFEPLFETLRQTGRMPWPTEVLLSGSSCLRMWGLPGMLCGAVTLFLCRMYFPADRIRQLRDRITLTLVGVGPLLRGFAIARFCRVLGTLLRNGVPMLQSLDIARRATGNHVLSAAIAAAADNIGAGRSLAGPLADSGQFPGDVIEMLTVAEQANRLEPVLIKLSETLESRSQRQLDLIMRMLEPAMMLVMAVIVGFLVVALLMPVFEGNGVM